MKGIKVPILIAGSVLLILTIAAITLAVVLLIRNNNERELNRLRAAGVPTLTPASQGGIVTDIPEAIPRPDFNEAIDGVITEADEALPLPPVRINLKSIQGLQRVDFNPQIGDVFNLHFDQDSGNLFLATVEPDQTRSIWRLSADLNIERVLSSDSQTGEIFLQADSRGVLYAGFANPGVLWRSEDLGDSWRLVADQIDGAFWALADDGRGTLWGALHAYNKALIYRSTDWGKTWQGWKDFHEVYPEYAVPYRAGDDRFSLRHLHSVAFYNNTLFVGVGDVTRFTVASQDKGETWQPIWSEGFTAGVPLKDRSGLLLGPDRLQTHGIALYDFASGKTTEVWSPIPYGYAGYTYSLLEMDGVYYAAFHTETNEVKEFSGKSGIIVSPDGYKWYPFLEFDPLTNWARTDIFMTAGKQVNSAISLNGYITLNGALYLFEPPIGRWFEVHSAFGE
ncbi:hypothetical protein KKF05_04205 [Patescibacteria group bacterium]|nr:hypothetical protein [Patescibacteria group bacterium]MBU1916060.1 hypothetical protein [Patescibacteria group bacterium]